MTATLRRVGVLNAPRPSKSREMAKRPSSEVRLSPRTFTSTSARVAFAWRNAPARSGTSFWMSLIPTPTLWKRLSVKRACVCSIMWQETQRPLLT